MEEEKRTVSAGESCGSDCIVKRRKRTKKSLFLFRGHLAPSISLSLFAAIIFSPPHERTNEKLSCMIKGCGKERKKKKKAKKSQWGEEEKEAKENGEEEKKIVTLLS